LQAVAAGGERDDAVDAANGLSRRKPDRRRIGETALDRDAPEAAILGGRNQGFNGFYRSFRCIRGVNSRCGS